MIVSIPHRDLRAFQRRSPTLLLPTSTLLVVSIPHRDLRAFQQRLIELQPEIGEVSIPHRDLRAFQLNLVASKVSILVTKFQSLIGI